MMQLDGYIYMVNLVDENLTDEAQRVSILQRMTTFIREMVGRSRFAYPSSALRQHVI